MINFIEDLKDIFGTRIIDDICFANNVYSALANKKWINNKDSFECTLREADALILELRDNKNDEYHQFYDIPPSRKISKEISDSLYLKGWVIHYEKTPHKKRKSV